MAIIPACFSLKNEDQCDQDPNQALNTRVFDNISHRTHLSLEKSFFSKPLMSVVPLLEPLASLITQASLYRIFMDPLYLVAILHRFHLILPYSSSSSLYASSCACPSDPLSSIKHADTS